MMCALKEIWELIIGSETAGAITFFGLLFAIFVWLLSIYNNRKKTKQEAERHNESLENYRQLLIEENRRLFEKIKKELLEERNRELFEERKPVPQKNASLTQIRDFQIANYENMTTSEVQRLAKQGDKNALYEMVWRMELLPIGNENNPIEQCAWQDYWFEKAANAGHIEGKLQYAQLLINNRVMNAENRQKAMKYFQSLVNDFDAGKLISKDDRESGIIAKLWLGIMLCEGYHTRRDAKEGVVLIKSVEILTNGFDGYGFVAMYKLGELYATGLAQPSEEPSIADLKKAIKYLDIAIKRFNPEKIDPRKLDFANLLLENTKGWIKTKMVLEDFWGKEKDERRRKMMEISDAARQRMEADKVALKRLRERLTH